MTLLDTDFWQWQAHYQPSHYLLALSGGRDSIALLHALAQQQQKLIAPLSAVYVNHHWHEQAQQWGQFCQAQAKQLGIECLLVDAQYSAVSEQEAAGETVKTFYGESSPEAAAREARYQALAKLMHAKSVLLTGHHQDDQAETLLLQLLRGSGVAGLAAMPRRQRFAQGEHWRPLLTVSRAIIEAFIDKGNIAYLDDPSNEELRYRRNYLRQVVMPTLTKAFPQAQENIARSADWLAEALTLEAHFLHAYLNPDCLDVLDFKPLQNKPLFLKKALLRYWLRQLGLPALGFRRLEEFLGQVEAQSGHPSLRYHGYVLCYHQSKLYAWQEVKPAQPPLVSQQTRWQGIGELVVVKGWESLATMTDLHWRLCPQGAAFKAQGARHHKPLKECLRLASVPPYLRQRTPVLMQGEKIVWVAGLGVAAGYEQLAIHWQKKAHSVSIPSYSQSVSDRS